MEKFKFDIIANTLTLSAAFVDAMNNPKSKEYALVRKFRKDFPSLRVIRKTHASPKSNNKHKNLTYERMERFMCALPDGEDYLAAYWSLRDKAEHMCASPYSAVSAWFMKQFPKFRSNPLFYLDNQPAIIDFNYILEMKRYQPSVDEAEGEKDA